MKIFDFDGTLADSNGVWKQVDRIFLGRRGIALTQEYLDVVGHAIFPDAAQFTKEYCRLDISPQAIMDEWMELAREAYACHIPLKPGAADYLALCRAREEQMILMTACVPALCRSALERHGLTDFFEELVFVEELGLDKRDPRVFTLTLNRLGIEPAQCTLYDDSPAACAAASSLGIAAVGIYDDFYAGRADELRAVCQRCIHDFTQLLEADSRD